MRIVVLLLLSAQLVLCSDRKSLLFLSQIQDANMQLTFREQREAETRGDDYFFQVNDRRNARVRRYMNREDGEVLGTYGDEDDLGVRLRDDDEE
jgi:hypothetical protein